MNYQAIFLPLLALAVFLLPRKLVAAPYLIAATHFPRVSIVSFGVSDLSMLRVLIVLGLMRVLLFGEWRHLTWCLSDSLILCFAFWLALSSFGHSSEIYSPFTMRLGMAGDYAGFYLITRCFLRDWYSLGSLTYIWVILLTLLAFMMLTERITMRNPYRLLGANQEVTVRNGKVRARGPFSHPILAGTAGASTIPFLLMQFRRRRSIVIIGTIASCSVVLLSNSSGPISTLILVFIALALWRWRIYLPKLMFIVFITLFILHLIKTRPVWYLMQYVDFTGGSTGWHRAALIDAAIKHFNEWWLFGTDLTRHWMPTGVSWSPDHVDMTNQFINIGVISGVFNVVIFALLFIVSFKAFWSIMRYYDFRPLPETFSAWCLGGALFAHLITFFTVAYFDQSYIYFFLIIGSAPSLLKQCLHSKQQATSKTATNCTRSCGKEFWA